MVPAVLRFIDTRGGSRNGHYVNYPVRGVRPAAPFRFPPPRFEPSRLRMRHIIRPQVVASAIHSSASATHFVLAVPHRTSSLAGTILIPNRAGPKRLPLAFFPQPSPALIHSSGRSQP